MSAWIMQRGRNCRPGKSRDVLAKHGLRIGLLTAATALAIMPASAQETVTYTYDPRGRITNVDHGSTGPNAGLSASYTYDPADNRTQVVVASLVAPPCSGVNFTIASNGAVTEGGSSVFTVIKSGSTSSTCTVNYATSGGTATSGSDFIAASGTLTFLPTQTSQTVSVATIDDSIVESQESFSMALSSPSSGSALGSPSSATGIINDNDVPPNQPPVANPDSATVASCGSVIVNVVANDTDPDGNYPLHVAAIVSHTNGAASISSSTSIQFDAVQGPKTGIVTYTVADSLGATSNGTLTVTIRNGICN
jgi:hypothetical protein